MDGVDPVDWQIILVTCGMGQLPLIYIKQYIGLNCLTVILAYRS